MSEYQQQAERIRQKLIQAKAADSRFQVFGAGSHKYHLNPPASVSEVETFEMEYQVRLPECYRTFITEIGNGGNSFNNSAAGPYYGIYLLGQGAGELLYGGPEKYLKYPCVLYPRMSDEAWSEINKNLDENDNLSDQEYEEERGRIFGGILPVGSQGCTYVHGIVLNGPYTGRVVNLDMDRQKPRFCFEKNFLDWYERWLDEIISGQIVSTEVAWFGFSRGGSEEVLLQEFTTAEDHASREECLDGLLNKNSLNSASLDQVEKLIKELPEWRSRLVALLCKSDYGRAKPWLSELLPADPLTVFQSIFWYAKKQCGEWFSEICKMVHTIQDTETFNFGTWVLMEAGNDYGSFIKPCAKSESDGIRDQAIYSLSKLKNKSDYLEVFIAGLYDRADRVVISALRALENISDASLPGHYRQLAKSLQGRDETIASQLKQRLSPLGYTLESILNS